MLRLIVNKAKTHFNTALELAERDRNEEAIAELENALDLDNNHVNSHVVLGTLYAKNGQLDKAEEQWKEALELDPRFMKAHQYMEKAHTARRTFPIAIRQRRLIIFLVILALATFGLLLWERSQSSNYQPLREAWSLYMAKNYAGAMDEMQDIADSHRDSPQAEQAEVLLEMIHAEQNLMIRCARQQLDAGNVEEVDNILWDLIKRTPSAVYMQEAMDIAGKNLALAREKVMRAMTDYQSRQVERDKVEEALAQYAELHNAPPESDDHFLRENQQRLTSVTLALRLEDVAREYENQQIDEWAYLEKLTEISNEFPEAKIVRKIIDELSVPMRKRWIADIEASIAEDNFAEAEKTIALLDRLIKTTPGDEGAEKISEFREQIQQQQEAVARQQAETEVARKLADARQAFEQGNYAKTLELADEIAGSEHLDADEKQMIQAMVERANPRLALKRWKWMVARDQQYLNQTIGLEDAKKTIEIYPQVSEHLSRSAYPGVQDNMLLYLALAQRSLGLRDESYATIERIKQEYPDNNVQNWVEKFDRPE
ncbi:MAG: tetratricopeptide repeat protein [Candidatus Sumerlaeia bacterium]